MQGIVPATAGTLVLFSFNVRIFVVTSDLWLRDAVGATISVADLAEMPGIISVVAKQEVTASAKANPYQIVYVASEQRA